MDSLRGKMLGSIPGRQTCYTKTEKVICYSYSIPNIFFPKFPNKSFLFENIKKLSYVVVKYCKVVCLIYRGKRPCWKYNKLTCFSNKSFQLLLFSCKN